jgi:hypothetical protein
MHPNAKPQSDLKSKVGAIIGIAPTYYYKNTVSFEYRGAIKRTPWEQHMARLFMIQQRQKALPFILAKRRSCLFEMQQSNDLAYIRQVSP